MRELTNHRPSGEFGMSLRPTQQPRPPAFGLVLGCRRCRQSQEAGAQLFLLIAGPVQSPAKVFNLIL